MSCSVSRVRIILISIAIAGLTVGACSEGGLNEEGGKDRIVASIYPLAFLAERLGGGCVDVTNVTPAGVEPHDLELTPDAVEAVVTADVVLYLGGGFQPALEEAVGDAQGRVIDVLDSVSTVAAGEDEAEEGLTVDPHVWLDPARFDQIAGSTADVLAEEGMAHACDLEASEEELRADLDKLDASFRRDLSSCVHDVFVTSHAAFGYLADAYGLRQEAIAGLEPQAEPSARRLAEIEELVREEGVTTIFTEELVSPDVAETIARETGARTALLYTIEGLTPEQLAAGEDYLSLMRKDLDELRTALDCDRN
jgi:zinc transport system substrate-binding protein